MLHNSVQRTKTIQQKSIFIVTLLFVLNLAGIHSYATTCTATQSGNWNDPNTWDKRTEKLTIVKWQDISRRNSVL